MSSGILHRDFAICKKRENTRVLLEHFFRTYICLLIVEAGFPYRAASPRPSTYSPTIGGRSLIRYHPSREKGSLAILLFAFSVRAKDRGGQYSGRGCAFSLSLELLSPSCYPYSFVSFFSLPLLRTKGTEFANAVPTTVGLLPVCLAITVPLRSGVALEALRPRSRAERGLDIWRNPSPPSPPLAR